MSAAFYDQINQQIDDVKAEGLYKSERIITSAQKAAVSILNKDGVDTGEEVLNFCANNYLGLANHPELIKAAKAGMDEHGFGMASVRFICGTQDSHKELEQKLSSFLGTEDTILYSSCFDANAGLFETILGTEDAIISDALNHASIIDGVRLCKAKRFRYANNNMAELEAQLIASSGPKIVSNRPALASKHEVYRIVSSVPRKSDSFCSSLSVFCASFSPL